MEINALLELMVNEKASDLFVTAGLPPSLKVDGHIHPVGGAKLSPAQSRELVFRVMDNAQRTEFEASNECNFGISVAKLGRFRISAFVQRGQVGMVVRRIETHIPDFEELHLPSLLGELVLQKKGLVLLVGATGTGKSTTLASMIGHRNLHGEGHVVTLEDPIEFVHPHGHCVVTQREIGIDCESYGVGLRNTLRQAPDVILIGEIRTEETMDYAMGFAETGHLVLSTLHATNVVQALDRVSHLYPEERRPQAQLDLAMNVKAIVAQQLLPRARGAGRMPALEILVNTPLASDIIRKGQFHRLKDLMRRSGQYGMVSYEQSLFDLISSGEITVEEGLHAADSANELRLMLKLNEGRGGDVGTLEDVELLDTR